MKKKVFGLSTALFIGLSALPILAQPSANAAGSDEARNLNSQAIALYRGGKYGAAIKLQKQALALWEKELGKEHRLIVIGSTNLGEMYRALQRYDEASEAYQRALKIQEKLLGPEHPDLVTLLIKMGWMRHGVGKASDAEALFKRAVAISEKQGADHPSVAEPSLYLASFYQKIGRPGASIPIYQRVIAIQEKHFGRDGQQLVATLEQYACALRLDKKWTEANEMMQRAASIEGKPGSGLIVAREGVLTGQAINRVQPHYPQAAKEQRLSGSVLIKVEIDESGSVRDAKILCGADLLAVPSLEAALRWTFTPTTLNGEPVKVKGVLTFNFTLQ